MARRRLLKGLRASFIAVMVIVISIYMLNLPVTESFFTSQYKTEEPITLTVTTEIKTIGVAFDFGQPAAPMALMMASMSLTVDAIEPTEPASDHIVGIVHFDSGYDMSKVEQSTVMVFSDMHVIPVVRAQLSTDSMELFFSRVPTETMLGHGTHVIYVTGAFSDGWVHFCGEGQLQVIDPEVVALELAQDMMIDLESTQDLTQAKIDLCREAIGQGKEGPEKDNLFSRLETVQQAFSLAEISFEFAQEMMTSLETDVELTQQKIDLCREAIGQVTDGLEKDSLTTKLKLVQERFSAEQASLLEAQYDEAEVALVNAEASNLQADYDIAAALINALPVGEESSELLAGLEAISVIIPEPAVDDNAAGDAGDEGSTDGDGDYNPTSDIGDEGSTNDADADADADDEDDDAEDGADITDSDDVIKEDATAGKDEDLVIDDAESEENADGDQSGQ